MRHVLLKVSVLKIRLLSVRLTSVLLLLLLLTQSVAAGQSSGAGLTKEEQREAREVAAAFTDRLIETRDFAPVVKEFYVADFMTRFLKSADMEGKTFMLDVVPSLSFKPSLAARTDSEYWPRLYVAANNILHFGVLSIFSKKTLEEFSDPDKFDERDMLDVYPPEAVKLLDDNPILANFLKKKGNEVVVTTPEDLRVVTTTLEEAVRLTRARLNERLAKGTHLTRNFRMMRVAAARTKVSLLPSDDDSMGYPKGTRLFEVFVPITVCDLILVKEGGSMKVVRASITDD
jgi:hypothetical protein